VLPLEIPPLRNRTDDIPELAEFFLRRCNRDVKKQIEGFSEDAMEILLSYDWPGNVRELENVVERSVVLCNEKYISSKDLFISSSGTDEIDKYSGKSLKDAVNLFKRHFIRSTLDRHGWRQKEAAEALGIQRTYLSRLIKELNIQKY
jgi:Nif-specific regulatory protein